MPQASQPITNIPTTTTYWAVGSNRHHPTTFGPGVYDTPRIEYHC